MWHRWTCPEVWPASFSGHWHRDLTFTSWKYSGPQNEYNTRIKSSLADLIGSGTGRHAVQVKGHGRCGFQRVSVEPVSHGDLNKKKDAIIISFCFINAFQFQDNSIAVVWNYFNTVLCHHQMSDIKSGSWPLGNNWLSRISLEKQRNTSNWLD